MNSIIENKSLELSNLDGKKREDLTDILVEIPWEWHCSMNLPNGCDSSKAIKLIKKWQDTLFATDTIQIGCKGIFDPIPHPHLHILAIGSSDKLAMLTEDDIQKAQNCWSKITQQSISITTICCQASRMGVLAHILLQDTPSGLSVPITADFKGQLEGEGPYDEELFGPIDTDDGDKYEEYVGKLREVVTGMWSMADDSKIIS